MSTHAVTPRRNVMIGLTHDSDGTQLIKESKVLKIGIGHAQGKACDVYVNADGKWVVRSATEGPDRKLKFATVATLNTRKEAEAVFRAEWKKAPICTYPRKTTYFNVTRKVMGDDGVDFYVPDFEAIEALSFADPLKPGPPTEIDIIFYDNEPYEAGFQNWAASELKCYGDGENAARVLSMAKTPEEQSLAKEAQAQGKKYFPVVGGCWAFGCPYTKESTVGGRTQPAPCKPSATIKFQLIRNPRVGGTPFFHTGSFKSIPQISSSLARIRMLTGGRVAGIPLKMVVRSHKTNHNGQSAVQQNVSIEVRAEDMEQLRKTLLEQAWKFENFGLGAGPQRIGVPAEDLEEDVIEEGGALYIDDEPEGDITPAPAATATAAATSDLSERLAKARTAPAADPAHPVAGPAKDHVPWDDRNEMNVIYRRERDRISEPRCNEIFAANGVMLASLRPEDPRAAAVYRDMLASPTVIQEKKKSPDKTSDSDLF